MIVWIFVLDSISHSWSVPMIKKWFVSRKTCKICSVSNTFSPHCICYTVLQSTMLHSALRTSALWIQCIIIMISVAMIYKQIEHSEICISFFVLLLQLALNPDSFHPVMLQQTVRSPVSPSVRWVCSGRVIKLWSFVFSHSDYVYLYLKKNRIWRSNHHWKMILMSNFSPPVPVNPSYHYVGQRQLSSHQQEFNWPGMQSNAVTCFGPKKQHSTAF